MKTRVWGAVAVAGMMVTAACGGSKSGNTGGAAATTTGSHTTTTTSATVGSGAGGAGGMMDAICTNPMATPPNGCVTCIDMLQNTQPCITTFADSCKADSACIAYALCLEGCQNDTTHGSGGAGGGAAACAASDGMGGAGGADSNCVQCCINGNMSGSTAYVTDLLDACVCQAGAPCASACM